jgi:hypothetical protein
MNKLMTSLLGTFLVLTNPAVPAKRREAGQGSLEYVGMIAVAALIIAAVALVAKSAGPQIGAFITAAITKVQTAVAG